MKGNITVLSSEHFILSPLGFSINRGAYERICCFIFCAQECVERDSSYKWVDPHVLNVPTCFRGLTALDDFLSKVSILKPDSPSDAMMTIVVATPTGYVMVGRTLYKISSLYILSFFFTICASPFLLTKGVLRILNVAPSQLHPNS